MSKKLRPLTSLLSGVSCANCVFAEESELLPGETKVTAKLMCKRLPPSVAVIDNTAYCLTPKMDSDDWCGEFKPKCQ